MKKKIFAAAAMLLACVTVLCACGGGGASTTGGTDEPKEITGETIDTGVFSALCPDGWWNCPQQDIWAEEEGALDPETLQFFKGGSPDDYFSKPFVTINYASPDNYFFSTKGFYDEVTDLEGVTFQGKEVEEAFTAVYNGIGTKYTYTIFDYVGEDAQWHVTILTELDGKATGLGFEDPETMAILNSITLD